MDVRSVGSLSQAGPAYGPASGQTASAPSASTVQDAPPAAPVETAQAVRQAASVPSQEQLQKALSEINKTLDKLAPGLQFTLDPDLHSLNNAVVKIVDRSTNEVLRQIPSEESIAIAKALDRLQGLLIKQEA